MDGPLLTLDEMDMCAMNHGTENASGNEIGESGEGQSIHDIHLRTSPTSVLGNDGIQQLAEELEDTFVWKNENYKIMSRICNCLALSNANIDILIRNLRQLDFSMEMPKSASALKKEEVNAMESTDMRTLACPVKPPYTRDGHCMVESTTVHLIHRDLLKTCEKIINTGEHSVFAQWKSIMLKTDDGETPCDTGEMRLINEMWTGDWWEREQKKLGKHAHILAPIISADETPMTMTGRNVLPVYCTVGNIHKYYKTKRSGWALLGFIPTIRPIKAYTNTEAVREYRRKVKRWAMWVLTKDIVSKVNGYVFTLRLPDESKSMVVYPRMPLGVADEMELKSFFTGSFGSTNSTMPCTNCDSKPKLNENGIRHVGYPRDIRKIRQWFDYSKYESSMTQDFSMEHSIHTDFNAAYFIPGYDPTRNPSCPFHQFEHGNYTYMQTACLLFMTRHCPSGTIGKFDCRWAELGTFPGCKKFIRGVSTLAWVTAHEQRMMTMGFPFVVRGLVSNVVHESLPCNIMEQLSICYLALRWLTTEENWTDRKLKALSYLATHFQDLMDMLHLFLHDCPMNGKIKFHKLAHWGDFIMDFGMTGGYDMGVFDSAHKFTCKVYKRSLSYKSNGNAEKRLMWQNTVNDYHMDSDPLVNDIDDAGFRERRKRTGAGGVRGKLRWEVDDAVRQALRNFEGNESFNLISLEDQIAKYQSILPDNYSLAIKILSWLVSTNHAFDNIRIPERQFVDSPMVSTDEGHVTFFSPHMYNNVQLYNAAYCNAAKCYIRENMHVAWSVPGEEGRRVQIGRVKWIMGIRDEHYIVLQKFRVIPIPYGPRNGELPEERIIRHAESNWCASDPIKAHFWFMSLLNESIPNSYVVIYCNDASKGKIDTVVQVQPDFCSTNTDEEKYFLLEYMI